MAIERQTWLLLHFLDEEAEEVRVELSLPNEITERGFVMGWLERLILPPISIAPTPGPLEDALTDAIDINITRRAG